MVIHFYCVRAWAWWRPLNNRCVKWVSELEQNIGRDKGHNKQWSSVPRMWTFSFCPILMQRDALFKVYYCILSCLGERWLWLRVLLHWPLGCTIISWMCREPLLKNCSSFEVSPLSTYWREYTLNIHPPPDRRKVQEYHHPWREPGLEEEDQWDDAGEAASALTVFLVFERALVFFFTECRRKFAVSAGKSAVETGPAEDSDQSGVSAERHGLAADGADRSKHELREVNSRHKYDLSAFM